MKYPPRPSVHTGHEGHACSAASPMISKPIEMKHGVNANHAASTAALHTALPLAAAAASGPILRDARRGPGGGSPAVAGSAAAAAEVEAAPALMAAAESAAGGGGGE